MGCSGSKTKSPAVVSDIPSVEETGQFTPLPNDTEPYKGPSLETLHVSVPVNMTNHFVSGVSAGASVTSNVDNYYPLIAGYLGQGYTLNTFYRVPGASSVAGFGSVKLHYEAVFCRPVGTQPSLPDTQLLVEKSTIHVQHLRGGILNPLGPQGAVANTSDMINKIYHHSSHGGRLVCAQFNGHAVVQGVSAAMAGLSHGIGVDVIFQIPIQPSPVRYAYQVVSVPIGISVQVSIPARVTVQCDWFGTMASYLSQGWKLVEIFMDQSQHQTGGFSTAGSMNSVWFFEKETSRLNDNTPIYQGTVLEHYHEVSVGFAGTKVKTDWSGVISEMGLRGWELACVQETPEVEHFSFGKFVMKLMMFFQRKIIGQPNTAPASPPPPYPGLPKPLATHEPSHLSVVQPSLAQPSEQKEPK